MAKMSKPGAVLTERKEYYCTPLVPASTCGNLLYHFFPYFLCSCVAQFLTSTVHYHQKETAQRGK